MSLMSLPEIASLIPHRAPMVLLDQVIWATGDSFCAALTISERDIFFDRQSGAVGAWIGIEYMAQAIAAFEGYWSLQRDEPVKIGFLLGSRNYESRCAGFVAGLVLHIEVHKLLQHENGLGAFECRISTPAKSAHQDSTVLATATVTVFKPDDVNQFLKK